MFVRLPLACAAAIGLTVLCSLGLTRSAHAQSTTVFTYQGYLEENGAPAEGTYDLRFILYDSASGGTQVGDTANRGDITVTGGVFAVELDFGAVFGPDLRYLEVAVRDGGSTGSFATLSPREALRPAPTAITALSLPNVTVAPDGKVGIGTKAPSSELTVSGAIETTTGGIVFPDGTSQTTAGVSSGNAWSLGGNAGTDPPTDYLGTSDDTPLEMRVDGTRGFRLEPFTLNGRVQVNVLGGNPDNRIEDSASGTTVGATIAGGGSTVGSTPSPNVVSNSYGAIGGGFDNTASGFASTIGGGNANTASFSYATIGGGVENTASALYATVGGGQGNTASALVSTVGGGLNNTASGDYATIGGGGGPVSSGENNIASGSRSTVGGGSGNRASGPHGTVGGGDGNDATGDRSTVGGGLNNTASNDEATVGGGNLNTASGFRSTVGGGQANTASGSRSTVGGGILNVAGDLDATVAGGRENTSSSAYATVGGGWNNDAFGDRSTVSGGTFNKASGRSAVVPGGLGNEARGDYSLAAGYNARVKDIHSGTFVWSDRSAFQDSLVSTGDNQFLVRATNFVGFNRTTKITGSEDFGVRANTPSGGFGGMYMETSTADGQPFYGYANNGIASAYHYFDPSSDEWILNVGGIDLRVNQSGDLSVRGRLSKGSGSFTIDHPLAPTEKTLSHSFVESPDMMNVYNGNVTLDADGTAVVALPDYFEALNTDFRYQLTPIGAPGPNLHVAREIAGNRFEIAGGTAGMRVSWQVTGIRNDPYAQKHRIAVEERKAPSERGQYLHPDAYGAAPASPSPQR